MDFNGGGDERVLQMARYLVGNVSSRMAPDDQDLRIKFEETRLSLHLSMHADYI